MTIKSLILFLGCILVAMSVSTQYVAYAFNYQPALGPNLLGLYPPWKIVSWNMVWSSNYPKIFALAKGVGALSATLGFLSLYLLKLFGSNTARGTANLHGSAQWAAKEDIKSSGLLGSGGVVVGAWLDKKRKIELRHDGPEHVLCYAPTRSGKGVGLVIPTLLSWNESAVITDLKGELWELTAGWRQKWAQNKVLRFEPASRSSIKWNPLEEIRIGTESEVGDVQNLASLIVDPTGSGTDGPDGHWKKTSSALLVGCILHLLYKAKAEGSEASLSALRTMLTDPSRPISELWDEMMSYPHDQGAPHKTVAQAGREIADKPDDERGSVLSSARSFLALYEDPVVAENVSSSEFRIKDLMNHSQPVSLYIITQPTDKDRLRPLVRIMVNMIIRLNADRMEFEVRPRVSYPLLTKFFRMLSGKSIKPIGGGRAPKKTYKFKMLLMLDEFPALGKLEILQESLAYIAGYGLKAYLITQDLNQLKSRDAYGQDETITSNAHVQIAFPPNRIETAKHISDLLGQTTVIKEQITTSGKRLGIFDGQVSRSYQEVSRPLMTPEECLHLPGPLKNEEGAITKAGQMLVFVAGFPAIKGVQPLYFQDEIYQARSAVDPPEHTDKIRSIKRIEINFDHLDDTSSLAAKPDDEVTA